MAVTRTQTFANATKAGGTGSAVTFTYGSIPTAGNLLVIALTAGDGGGAISGLVITDSIGDGVGWTAGTQVPVFPGGSNSNYRFFYKIVGTPSGGSKGVTATISGTQALTLFAAEYSSGGGTWAVDGSQVSNTGTTGVPDAGAITTANANAVVVSLAAVTGATPAAPTGFTQQSSANNWTGDYIADDVLTASGTTPTTWSWSVGSGSWVALGIAFGVISSAPSYYLSDMVEM